MHKESIESDSWNSFRDRLAVIVGFSTTHPLLSIDLIRKFPRCSVLDWALIAFRMALRERGTYFNQLKIAEFVVETLSFRRLLCISETTVFCFYLALTSAIQTRNRRCRWDRECPNKCLFILEKQTVNRIGHGDAWCLVGEQLLHLLGMVINYMLDFHPAVELVTLTGCIGSWYFWDVDADGKAGMFQRDWMFKNSVRSGQFGIF